jgi:hypothetical protein
VAAASSVDELFGSGVRRRRAGLQQPRPAVQRAMLHAKQQMSLPHLLALRAYAVLRLMALAFAVSEPRFCVTCICSVASVCTTCPAAWRLKHAPLRNSVKGSG